MSVILAVHNTAPLLDRYKRSLRRHYDWQTEPFCRFFKHLLRCRRPLSHSHQGIKIQTYCAIIACLLISLWIGRKPSLRTVS